MKNKYISIILIFCLGIIITYPAFPISHALDSYATMSNGYIVTSQIFLQNGRIITYLFYMFFNLIKLPFNSLGFISALFLNFFLALSIYKIYKILKENYSFNDKYKNYLLLLSIFLIFYNPLLPSVLVLDEAFVFGIGIYFLTSAAIKIFDNNKKGFFLSILFCFLGVCCYQCLIVYYFLIALLIFYSKKEKVSTHYFIKLIIPFLIAYLFNFIFIKFFTSNIKNVGTFSLFENIKIIVCKLLPNVVKFYFGFINIKIYYLIFILTLTIFVIYLIKEKGKINKIIFALIGFLICILIPFIPNLFMNSDCNYIEARMMLTALTPPIFLIILSLANGSKIKYILMSSVLIIYFGISIFLIHQNMMIDLKRYKNDINHISKITNTIDEYEEENNIKIEYIYYIISDEAPYYYDFGNNNGVNIRITAVNWAFESELNYVSNKKIKIKEITKKDMLKITNLDKITEDKFVFEDNKLYLVLY